MTVAPASPRAAAMPRPAPRVAPATTAIRPRSASGSGDHPMSVMLFGGAGSRSPRLFSSGRWAVARAVQEQVEQPAGMVALFWLSGDQGHPAQAGHHVDPAL